MHFSSTRALRRVFLINKWLRVATISLVSHVFPHPYCSLPTLLLLHPQSNKVSGRRSSHLLLLVKWNYHCKRELNWEKWDDLFMTATSDWAPAKYPERCWTRHALSPILLVNLRVDTAETTLEARSLLLQSPCFSHHAKFPSFAGCAGAPERHRIPVFQLNYTSKQNSFAPSTEPKMEDSFLPVWKHMS